MYACMHVQVCMYICMYVCMCMYACMYVRTYLCMYACMYAHNLCSHGLTTVYIYTYIRTLPHSRPGGLLEWQRWWSRQIPAGVLKFAPLMGSPAQS